MRGLWVPSKSLHRWSSGYLALGVFMGIAIALTAVSVFGMPDWLNSTSVSTLIGAIIGGSAALAAQLVAIGEQKADRIMQRAESDVAVANSIVIKLIRICTNIGNVRDHVLEGIGIGRGYGYFNNFFRFIIPITGE